MSQQPPTRAMREHPDLDQLKRQAKELLEAYRAQQPQAVAEVAAYHRTAAQETFALHDAQFVLARSYGFESWPKLKAAVDGVTAAKLHEAAERGDLETARALLTRRPEIVDLSIAGRGETCALHMAVLRRDLPLTKLLLEFGADPDNGIWPNRDASSPYVMARERGYSEIFDAIREAREQRGARGPKSPNETTRKLRQAVLSGDEDAVVAVFEQHPELAEVCPADGMTMLHQMTGRGALKLMAWLIDHGADVNRKAERTTWHPDWTPLEFAALGHGGDWIFNPEQFHAVAKLLLDRGAKLTPLPAAGLGRWDYLETCSKQDLEGKGVLEAAVKGNQFDTLVQLLDKGLDVDERIQVGNLEDQTWTAGGPLFQAVVLGRKEMVRLLLERGADPNANVYAAGSPTFRAYESRDPELIALIEQYGGRLDPGSAGYARHIEMARRMLAGEIGAPFEPSDFSGRTVAEQLLWGGASSSCAEIVRMALEHVTMPPADPLWFSMLWRPMPSPDGEGNTDEGVECFRMILARCGPHHRGKAYQQTMLHEAMSRNADLRVAELLLDAGAKLDARDRLLQSTPLGWACRWGRTEHVKLLLARGADPIERDAEPWATPRAWAEKMGHSEIVRLLG